MVDPLVSLMYFWLPLLLALGGAALAILRGASLAWRVGGAVASLVGFGAAWSLTVVSPRESCGYDSLSYLLATFGDSPGCTGRGSVIALLGLATYALTIGGLLWAFVLRTRTTRSTQSAVGSV